VIEAVTPLTGLETTIAHWNEIAAALGERNRKRKTTDLEIEVTTMKPVAVESTTLSTVTYDNDHEVLAVEFRDRSVYQYFEVPAEVHGAFMTAPSKGSYFNRNIRGRFAYVRLPSAPH
jgi:hypothetical protein